MNSFQKIIGKIFPPYKFQILRDENELLINSLIGALPNEYKELKTELNNSKIHYLDSWVLFPDFRFITKSYNNDYLETSKVRGKNFKLLGLSIFSKLNNQLEKVEFIIWDNYLSGIKISNSNYELREFDLNKIQFQELDTETVIFPPSDFEILMNSLEEGIKEKIDVDSSIEIELDGRTYFTILDLEDGNYIAIDKKQKVYSLVHDAKPASKLLKQTIHDFLAQVESGQFKIDEHLEKRY